MERVRVKIEGLVEPESAVRVARLGADAIGMVFADSPRRVDPLAARQITKALPPWVTTVGVFVNADPYLINEIARSAGLHYVQLHGEESPEQVPTIQARVLKAFRVKGPTWASEVRDWLAAMPAQDNFAGVLLDAYAPHAHGGTGQTFNWDLVVEARQAGRMGSIDPIILAGGLNPENVREAIRTVRPWAVDVASGVESAPGVKDFAKVETFIRNVNQTPGSA